MTKISIVTVCYNSKNNIESTISSVINQTYNNIEFLIIDGNSTDGTLDVIKKYSDKIAFWISEPDHGIYDAMNKGLRHATGEWICFMNSGDVFFNNEVIESVFNNSIYNQISVIFGLTIRNDKVMKLNPFFLSKHSLEMGFCHQSTFVRTEIAKKIKFNTNFNIAADFSMIYSIYESNGSFFNINMPISIFDDTGVSSKNKKKLLFEVASITHQRFSFYYVYKYFIVSLKEYLF